jgi:hypothetical protein
MKNTFNTTSQSITTLEKNEFINAMLELQINRKIGVKKITSYDINKGKKYHLDIDILDIIFTYQGNLLSLEYRYNQYDKNKVLKLTEFNFNTKQYINLLQIDIITLSQLYDVKYLIMKMLDKQYGNYTE